MLIDFNSIKVQLEPVGGVCSSVGVPSFQFHKGTIRTSSWCTGGGGAASFQFHKGTIRTGWMVSGAIGAPPFQVHKGTIRTATL